MTRTIFLSINETDLLNISGLTNPKELRAAIGYLSTWNLNYFQVAIHRVRDTELIAHYYKTDKDDYPSYTIGAVWHNGKYEFHS